MDFVVVEFCLSDIRIKLYKYKYINILFKKKIIFYNQFEFQASSIASKVVPIFKT